jgi:hypothetical protein
VSLLPRPHSFSDKKSQELLPRVAVDCAFVVLRRTFSTPARIRDAHCRVARRSCIASYVCWIGSVNGRRSKYRSQATEGDLAGRSVLSLDGKPLVSGQATSKPGLYFCGLIASPTGQLREIGLEAERISDLVNT